MQPTGVHHVSINVDDVDAARQFYVDVLGLTERTDRPAFSFDGAWLDVGAQQVHLIDAPLPPELGQHALTPTAGLVQCPSCDAS
jgi:glyoxylase I family protein